MLVHGPICEIFVAEKVARSRDDSSEDLTEHVPQVKVLGKRVKYAGGYAETHAPDYPMDHELKLRAVHHALCLEDKGPPSVSRERYDLADNHRNPTCEDIVDSKVLNEDIQQYIGGTSPDAPHNPELDGLRPERIPELLNPAGQPHHTPALRQHPHV